MTNQTIPVNFLNHLEVIYKYLLWNAAYIGIQIRLGQILRILLITLRAFLYIIKNKSNPLYFADDIQTSEGRGMGYSTGAGR